MWLGATHSPGHYLFFSKNLRGCISKHQSLNL
jgi:hypothetical protein